MYSISVHVSFDFSVINAEHNCWVLGRVHASITRNSQAVFQGSHTTFIPTCNEWEFSFSASLPASIWCYDYFNVSVLRCLFATHVSSSVNVCSRQCLLTSQMGYLFFSLLRLESSSHLPDTSPFSDMWFVNSISQLVVCLFIFINRDFHNTKVLNSDEIHFINFFCLWLMLL